MASKSTGVGGPKTSTVEYSVDDLDDVISSAEKQLKETATKVIQASADASKVGVDGSVNAAPLIGSLAKEAVGALVPVLKPLTDVAIDSSVSTTANLASKHLPAAIDKGAEKSIASSHKLIDKSVDSLS